MHPGELYQVVRVNKNVQVIGSNIFNEDQGQTFDDSYVNDEVNDHN